MFRFEPETPELEQAPERASRGSRDDPEGPGRAAFVDDLKGLLDHLGVRAYKSHKVWTLFNQTPEHVGSANQE